MGHSPDAFLYYGYNLPDEMLLPEAAHDTFMSGKDEVRIGLSGYQHSSPYVHWSDSERWASGYVVEQVDLATMVTELPDDVDDRLRAFATEHGLLLPGQKAEADDEYGEAAGEIGWWLASHYG